MRKTRRLPTIKRAQGMDDNRGFKGMRARIKELLKFSLVGGMNTLVDFGVFALLTGLVRLEPTVSHVLSYSCGVVNSYFFNRRWTFKMRNKSSLREVVRFVVVNLLSLGLSTLVINYLVEGGPSLNEYLGKLIATLSALAVNFTGSRLFVFKRSDN
ncbi:MAG TPA: GtrA family protein [Bacillota bacterium]|nr:GtrA family protein [Bacillota bacterium]